MEFVTGLFDTSDFPARWRCGHWTLAHGWLHILSDLGVWAAYFAIPLVLSYFAARRRDLPFRRVFLLFVAFILLCGTTHLMEAVIFWWPAYRLDGVLKLLTAVVSWVTVLALVRVAPTVLAMRTPAELEQEVAARTDAERRLTEANAELERRVEERTADLGRAVVALAEEKERLRTTLASIGDAVISTDRDGIVTYLNIMAELLTGWTNAEAAGVPLTRVFQIVNEDTRQPVENPALRALKEGVIVGLANHTVLIARDGTERPIDDSAAPIRCKDGEIVGGVLVFRDISERHRAETARRAVQQQLATTLESITDGFMRYDRDWRIVYVNSEAERINKLSRSEMLGQIVWDVFPALVGTKLETEFRRAVTGRETVEFEHHYVPFDRWYSLKGYPTADGGLTAFIRDITEQKVQQEALAASEARFRELADAMPQIVYVTDAGGRVEFVNRQWLDYTGQTAAQTADLSPVVHPDDLADVLRRWERSAATGTALESEFRLRRATDGEYRWFLTRSLPVRDAGGRVVQWYGTSTDIHDQKRAEQEIARLAAESERQRRLYETVLTNTPDFVYVFSLDHRVVYANDALIRMWGCGHEGAIGRTFLEIGYEPWHAEMHDREIDLVRATKQPIRGEVPFDGTHGRRQYDYIFVPVIGADGEVEAVAGTTRDVTERKEAERQLRDGQEQLDFALAAADLGQWSLNLTDHTASRTLRHDQIFGYDALLPEWTYETFLEHVIPDDRAAVDADFQKAVATGSTWAVECRIRRADGVVRYIWKKGVVWRNARGQVERMLSILGDITDRRRAEEELRRLAAELTEANRRKDEFLATLAHELRNPLAPIRNGLQVIHLAGVTGTVEQARSMMERQLGQMVRLVDDLLDVSRVTTGKLTLQTDRIELRSVIDAALETSRPLIEQAGHELAVVVPDETIVVEGDLTRLAQVVSNLLTNSAKYTHRGGHVRLTVFREDRMAVISVKDDGIGIPTNMLRRVFEMFTQVDRTLEKTTGGLGIGLSLVKGLVEMHGGTIAARSEGEGLGSEFVVRLPVASPTPASSDGSVKRGEEVVPFGRHRILIVDDNVDSADSIGQILEMLGNEVRTAYDGEAGVTAAGAFRPTVVLCDLGMPKLNGYEAARRIRAEPWGKNMVIVALTGWGQEDDRKRTADAGFDHHLVKPVQAAALMKLLVGLEATTA